MIITQTPLRVSLFGGGTDFAEFFRKEGGAVLSLGIDKYVYVIVKERFDDKIYVNYSKKEIRDSVDEIRHDLVRESLKKTGIERAIEITTLADVPSEGSGLGSSSSVTVGLLNAFYTYRGIQVTQGRLAREACEIEIDILRRPIGVQDQYIAAFGNLQFFRFHKSGRVTRELLDISEAHKRKLVSNLLLFYTNKTRKSSDVLSEQRRNIPALKVELGKLRDMALKAKRILKDGDLDGIGELLYQSWLEKKKLSRNISNSGIEKMYACAIQSGALGGKISGAGAGGFILLYCPREKQNSVREALKGYRELPFLLSRDGSKVIFNVRGYEWR